jgi:hypothetical protein
MRIPTRGRLLPSSDAPVNGEHVEDIIHVGDVAIEQIISGVVDEPVDYNQDHDEWVVLLEGTAELEVNGKRLFLEQGDWVLLPRRTPHASYGPRRGRTGLPSRNLSSDLRHFLTTPSVRAPLRSPAR